MNRYMSDSEEGALADAIKFIAECVRSRAGSEMFTKEMERLDSIRHQLLALKIRLDHLELEPNTAASSNPERKRIWVTTYLTFLDRVNCPGPKVKADQAVADYDERFNPEPKPVTKADKPPHTPFVIFNPYQFEGDLALGVWSDNYQAYRFGDGDCYDPEQLSKSWPGAKLLTWVELEARLKSHQLVWTKEPPKEAGWYWTLDSDITNTVRQQIAYVCSLENDGGAFMVSLIGKRGGRIPVASLSNYQWSGPIPQPVEA